MNFVAGKAYEGYVWVRAEKTTDSFAALESRDGSHIYARDSGDRRRQTIGSGLNFTLTPTAADQAGRFALKLKPARLGHARPRLSPTRRMGPLQGPARAPRCRRRLDRPRHHRAPLRRLDGQQRRLQVEKHDRPARPASALRRAPGIAIPPNGWGIPDFMNFCEAAGFEYVPDFNMDETPQDMADFIEYAKGPADTVWGRSRAADGHPAALSPPLPRTGQ